MHRRPSVLAPTKFQLNVNFKTAKHLPHAANDGREMTLWVEVKRFQTIGRCGVDVTHGLVLLFGIGTKALVWIVNVMCTTRLYHSGGRNH